MTACAAPPARLVAPEIASSAHVPGPQATPYPDFSTVRKPQHGTPFLHGFIGVSFLEEVSRSGGGAPPVDGTADDLDKWPLIGGGGQWTLGGDRVGWGLEGLLSFGGRANAAAFAFGGGGGAIAVNVDLLIFDIYGGPFVTTFFGDGIRAYAGAGPLVQWSNWDQSDGLMRQSGSGFGTGFYARTGIEFPIRSRTLLGFGVRWTDSRVDLDGGLGDLDLQGLEVFLSVTEY